MSGQVKIFFNSIIEETKDSYIFGIACTGMRRNVCRVNNTCMNTRYSFKKKEIIKLCHIYGYILIRKQLARKKGLI